MRVDKNWCMSSYLMYRTIARRDVCFAAGVVPRLYVDDFAKAKVHNAAELGEALQSVMQEELRGKKAALALSGGMDSAILARYMPQGSVTYTFRCVVPGVKVTDESARAKECACENHLENKAVEVYWEDFDQYAPLLMRHKGAPIHSIEVQIYKAALQAKADGCDAMVFGESADINYGGMSSLLAKDWIVGEFINRYSYVLPYTALRHGQVIVEPFAEYEQDGRVDAFEFCRKYFLREAMGTYTNACECAGIKLICPYVKTTLDVPLDYGRVRAGGNKYLVRELFNSLYGGEKPAEKIPMPRPMGEWLGKWEGPKRGEFWPHCTDSMTGDQRWMVWALERFLNLLDEAGKGADCKGANNNGANIIGGGQ